MEFMPFILNQFPCAITILYIRLTHGKWNNFADSCYSSVLFDGMGLAPCHVESQLTCHIYVSGLLLIALSLRSSIKISLRLNGSSLHFFWAVCVYESFWSVLLFAVSPLNDRLSP